MSDLNRCCLAAVFVACENQEREIAALKAASTAQTINEDGELALLYLAELVKARKGGEFEWMPAQRVWRGIRALLVKAGRL